MQLIRYVLSRHKNIICVVYELLKGEYFKNMFANNIK